MDLTAGTCRAYFTHAFSGIEKVLDRLDDETVNRRPDGWGTNSVAALVVHCCELAPFWLAAPGSGRPVDRNRDAEFTTEATIAELRERIADSRSRCDALVEDLEAGPSATDHELRAFLPRGDQSDASIVLHVLEELYQHLGLMEVTADALGR